MVVLILFLLDLQQIIWTAAALTNMDKSGAQDRCIIILNLTGFMLTVIIITNTKLVNGHAYTSCVLFSNSQSENELSELPSLHVMATIFCIHSSPNVIHDSHHQRRAVRANYKRIL